MRKEISMFGKAVCMFACMTYLSVGCQKDITQIQENAPKKTGKVNTTLAGPTFVSAHRANDLIKVDEIINEGINSLEVDIYVANKDGQPTCLIGHEAGTATGQTLEQYFANLNQKLPGYTSLWLDCKDLNSSANEQLFLKTLKKMDSLYSIKNKVLIESMYPQHLTGFKQLGWTVSYYCNWSDLSGKTAAQQQVVMDAIYSKLNTYGVDGISYDASVDNAMKSYFPTKTVGGERVKMYAWALSRYYGETDLASKLATYSHLDILLITFYSPQGMLINGANYKIASALTKEPSKLVDVNGNPPINGEDVTLWTYNYPTSSNQVWKLRNVGSGYYALKSVADTTKALEVRGGGSANSTPVQVATFANTSAQRWKITYVGSGNYNLEPASAPGKNLDVNGSSTTDDTQIQIYSAHTGNAQKFRLVKQ
ncbi:MULTISPECIES: RICIN domain-containing protein [Sphingobacterium]|uniref:RICIN domain-containing protein n=1 Tax=Sphingobacterium TaxID=28453 RepID=UPI0025806B7B|nr:MULTISPECIES: RICIN domain-containing protein [Sphingobacterium]